MIFPMFIPNDNDLPPTLYSLMESIVNYPDGTVKIENLSEIARNTIFDFKYPLANNINKSEFENIILNHFIMAHIGFETFTAFKIQLSNKLNTVMPKYNKMFEAFADWELFNKGEKIKRDITEDYTNNKTTDTQSETKTNIKSNDTTDRRYSKTPENQIEDIKAGRYVSEYEYNQGENNSDSTGNDKSNTTEKGTNNGKTTENIEHSVSMPIEVYTKFENVAHIYNVIFKDLECLFYQLV